jgi:uncharacterized delta-60 repeat protein
MVFPEIVGAADVLLAVQNDGRIVVQVQGNTASPDMVLIALVRFLNDGSLDPAFGTVGVAKEFIHVYTSGRPDDYYPRLAAMDVQTDRKIVTVFNVSKYRVNVAQVVRYNADGTPDASFMQQQFGNQNGGRYIHGILLAIENNDKIVIAYTSDGFSPTPQIISVVRLNNNGSFAGGGFDYGHTDLPPRSESASSLAVQDDGKILVVTLNKLLRFGTDGLLDATFGTGGIVTPSIASVKILPQPDGKIIIGGGYDNGQNNDFALARYNSDGTLDPSFGNGGVTISDFGGNEVILNMGIANSRLYAYDGSSSDILAAYRLNTSTPLCTPPTFLNNNQIVLDASECGNDGNISIIPLSGTAPFMYSINGGATYFEGPASGRTFQELPVGTYQLRLKDANGCESAIVTREIKLVYGAPCRSCTPPTFLNDQTIVLDALCSGSLGNISIIPLSGTAPFMYSIDGGVTYVSGPNQGYTFQNVAPGTYQLRLKDANGCESAPVTRTVNVVGPCEIRVPFVKGNNQQGRNDDGSIAASVYPNPSSGQFRVQLHSFGSAKMQVQILDSRGSVVEQKQVNASKGSTLSFNLSGKAKGLYLIRVVDQSGITVSKLLIQ